MTASPNRHRRTLSGPTARLDGIGLHSGTASSVRFLPAPAGTGRIFHDLTSGQEISACVRNVVDCERCTVLGAGSKTLSTVEHVLSALAGLELDDVIIETTGDELPAADGSAQPFVKMLEAAGSVDTDGTVAPIHVARALMVAGDDGACIVCFPSECLEITVILNYPDHPFIGTQSAEVRIDSERYCSEIGPARTYGFLSELTWLQQRGLGLGATRDNVVALRDDGYDTELRYANELARHKMLDLLGDLSLMGRPLVARVYAIKPGHRLNILLASKLLTLI